MHLKKTINLKPWNLVVNSLQKIFLVLKTNVPSWPNYDSNHLRFHEHLLRFIQSLPSGNYIESEIAIFIKGQDVAIDPWKVLINIKKQITRITHISAKFTNLAPIF